MENIEVFTQSSIKITKSKIIYFDAFKIEEEFHDADYIFITHDHYDHFDKNSILKVKNDKTKIIVPKLLVDDVKDIFNIEDIVIVEPNHSYKIDDLVFSTVPAYNLNKSFHPKENGWVGYIVTIDDVKYYMAGDTDALEENQKLDCDVAFVPIGGYYTMDYEEAANFINILKPKVVVPIHYGSIVGSIDLGQKFENLLDKGIMCQRLLEDNLQ